MLLREAIFKVIMQPIQVLFFTWILARLIKLNRFHSVVTAAIFSPSFILLVYILLNVVSPFLSSLYVVFC